MQYRETNILQYRETNILQYRETNILQYRETNILQHLEFEANKYSGNIYCILIDEMHGAQTQCKIFILKVSSGAHAPTELPPRQIQPEVLQYIAISRVSVNIAQCIGGAGGVILQYLIPGTNADNLHRARNRTDQS